MFEDQSLKRKEPPKDSDKVTSETSGEAKFLEAVTPLTLNLESERRAVARDRNTVFKIREAYVDDGQCSRVAARDQGENNTEVFVLHLLVSASGLAWLETRDGEGIARDSWIATSLDASGGFKVENSPRFAARSWQCGKDLDRACDAVLCGAG